MLINDQHAIISNLDIFAQVGRGVAYDEIVPFTVSNNVLAIHGENSEFDGTLVVEFAKVYTTALYTLYMYLLCNTT